MNEMTAYLISRLDAIGIFVIFFMCIIPFFGGVGFIVASFEDDLTERRKKTLKIVGICLFVVVLFGAILRTCIPSTKEMIIIKLAPKITNVENLQLLKENIIEITSAIGSALK